MASAKLNNINIHVSGDIGLLDPQVKNYNDGKYNKVEIGAYGFISDNGKDTFGNTKNSKENHFRDVTNLNIKVDGSILAGSIHSIAQAAGLGYNVQAKKFKDVKLEVKGDIKAINKGSTGIELGTEHTPISATGIAHNLHYLENVEVKIGGSIESENNVQLSVPTYACGIGAWDYENRLDKKQGLLESFPLTIKNVNLSVGGDIKVTSKTNKYNVKKPIIACAGFSNNMSSGLDNYDVFKNNTIDVKGDIVADSLKDNSIASLWGYFMGDNNSLSAKSLKVSNENGEVLVAPFIHFLKGKNNKISLKNGIVAKGKGGDVAGFADTVTQFDGINDKNTIDVKGFDLKGIGMFGGFAVSADKHENQKNVEIDVKNVDLSIGDVKIQLPQEKALIGGFIANNKNDRSLTNNKVVLGDLTVNGNSNEEGYAYVGGFVGYNSGTIDKSSANLKSINIIGENNKYNHSVGGFVGYGYGGAIDNSTAFVEDSISTSNGKEANVGGFAGCIYDGSFKNNAAQLGENIETKANSGAANAGGFAGALMGYEGNTTVDKSTSLVFGDITAESNANDDSVIAAGFVGILMNTNKNFGISNSASYVGGKLTVGGQSTEQVPATGLGAIDKATLKGFTVLANITDNKENNEQIYSKYVGAILDEVTLDNNFVTEVKDGNRKAFKLKKDGNNFKKGDEVGNIDIAGRDFQKDYWGKDLNSTKSGKENFAYLEKNDKKINFQAIASGLESISTSPFKNATLADFYTRHLALLLDDGPIYDILGIPAGEPKKSDNPEEPKKPDEPKHPEKTEEPKERTFSFIVDRPILNTENHFQYLIGYKDNTFRPENNMTREEVAVMFARLLKNRPIKGKVYAYDFSDVKNDRWSVTAISYMNELGIIKGYPDNTFRPQNTITRAEFAAIATRFDDLAEGSNTFIDIKPEHWAYQAVSKASSAGWISGYPDNTFKPEKSIKRSEVVTLVNKMLNRYGDEKFIDANKDKILYFSDIDNHWAYYAIVEATNGHDFERAGNGKDEFWKDLNALSFVYDK